DVDETCRKLEAAGAKPMTNRTDPRHAPAAGARSYYEIKFRGPDNQEVDVTASGWVTGEARLRRERATSLATPTNAWTSGSSLSRRQAVTVSSAGPAGVRRR